MNRKLAVTAYLLGLLAVGWAGFNYIGHSPLALTMTALIGVAYLAGGLELLRFQQATASLGQALENIPDPPDNLADWLGQVHPSLQTAVRLRVEGERAGLPGPAVTPYLVGLLVLLGMLGTFLGMVVTLNGAVLALESTTDLHAIRAALAAPVKGLGVAFGTSVAGVAASAMLGLVSTLCRRQRLLTGQQLDTRIAGALRGFSLGHQRQEAFKAIQAQAQALPEVVNTLQTMMAQLERHNQQLAERLLAGQEAHYREARGLHAELAASVDASLREGLVQSARMAGEVIRPAVEATMGDIARETTTLREALTDTVSAQLDGLAGRFERSVTTVSDTWTRALARHEAASDALTSGLDTTLGRFADTFEQRAAALLASVGSTHAALQAELAGSLASIGEETRALHTGLAGRVEAQLDGLAERFGHSVTTVTDGWTSALARHERTSEALAHDTRAALTAFVDGFQQGSASLLATVGGTHASLQATTAQALAELGAETRRLHSGLAERVEAQLDGLSGRFGSAVTTVADGWTAALARHEATSEALARDTRDALAAFVADFRQGSAAQLDALHAAHATLQAELASRDARRLAETTQALDGLAIGSDAGSAAPGAFLHGALFDEDIQATPHWAPLQAASRGARIKRIWSAPVVDAGGALLGVFLLLGAPSRLPPAVLRGLLDMASRSAAIGIGSARSTAARQAGEERLRLALAAAGMDAFEYQPATDHLQHDGDITRPWKLPGECTGAAYIAHIHPDDRPALLDARARLRAEAPDYTAQYRLCNATGRFIWLAEWGRASFDASGQLDRIFGVCRDVTGPGDRGLQPVIYVRIAH